MAPFTREQRAVLNTILRMINAEIGELLAGLQRANTRFVALHNILGSKGVITAEEWQAELTEVEAAVAVDMALDPDLRALEERLRRLLENDRPGERPSE